MTYNVFSGTLKIYSINLTAQTHKPLCINPSGARPQTEAEDKQENNTVGQMHMFMQTLGIQRTSLEECMYVQFGLQTLTTASDSSCFQCFDIVGLASGRVSGL